MSLRKELIEACHKVYQQGFVAATDGNLSCRISKNRFLITPSGKSKGELCEKDLLEIDENGKILKGSGKVSTEFKLHLFVYKNREEVKSVIHCHPVFATAFAASGLALDKPVFPEVILTLGKIPICKYATPSTKAVTSSMEPYIKTAWAMLLANHGAVTLGKNIRDAFYKMEKLEHTAKTIFVAKLLGGEKILSRKNVIELYSIAEKVYGAKSNIK
ncbi:MAG: class II aldolase/adducin family protein [Ignavibacteriales bacterium]|nr:class II aldolase/adducin family protein [Ignavibacteriales bacterium]